MILASTGGIRSARYTKPGRAGVVCVDGVSIDTHYTEEVECLPGRHTVVCLVQLEINGVSEGTLAIHSCRFEKELVLKPGYTYRIRFNPESEDGNLEESRGP